MKYSKYIRNLGIASLVVSPIVGWIYIEVKMKNMEKGIHDDLARIKAKGKTLADIPRKVDWMITYELSIYAFYVIVLKWDSFKNTNTL